MTIQFNTDNHLSVSEDFNSKLTTQISDKLKRFNENITRVEVHLSDENGHKSGDNDKKCLLEARVEGKQPIVVTALANNYELAVDSALDKLKRSLDTLFDKMQSR